jgi:hypothetical protein
MKYCTTKDAKLRLQCLCELCALCGETLNGSRQSAVNIELLSSPHSFLHYPTATASALYPATAARQGGSVAVSLVDSYEFRTADERVIFLQPMAQFDHLVALPDSEDRARAINEEMESIEGDYENLRGVLPKSEY